MRYAYYPGCALMGTAADFDRSARQVMRAFGIDLAELEDWNCCGASATGAVNPDLTVALSARNLALAEEQEAHLAVACAACYTNLRRARAIATSATPAGRRVRDSLAEVGRKVRGSSEVHHLLEIVLREVGLERVREAVRRPLKGLKVAAYYGCQLGRPAGGAVHPEIPTEMDEVLAALGADPVPWTGKVKCCGGSIIMTKEEAALPVADDVLVRAERAGAQVIVTACPMCQMNLDAYQSRMNAALGRSHRMPVVYFTQLMGLAMGLDPKALGLEMGIVPAMPVLAPYLEEVEG